MVGEGGNLGFTQLGRVEYALSGGRINTDAIDNSAGVDCSDHEVNIKILLNAAMRSGRLALGERNKLLAEMTDEVAALVLRDNYFQTQSLSVSGALAPGLLDVHERFIKHLEKAGRLNRALEFLPDDEEFAERRAAKQGLDLARARGALAYAKIALNEALVDSDVPDDPFISTALERYFPARCAKPFRAIYAHPLRREIIATHVTNSMVNRVGSTFVYRMQDEAQPADVVRAYLIVREVFGFVDLWREIEALDYKVPDRVQTAMIIDGGRLIVRATLWFLRNRAHLGDIARAIEHFGAGAASRRCSPSCCRRRKSLLMKRRPGGSKKKACRPSSRVMPRASTRCSARSTSSRSPASSPATSIRSRACTSSLGRARLSLAAHAGRHARRRRPLAHQGQGRAAR